MVFQTKDNLSGHFVIFDKRHSCLCQDRCSFAYIENVTCYDSPLISRWGSSSGHIPPQLNTHNLKSWLFRWSSPGSTYQCVCWMCQWTGKPSHSYRRKASEFHPSTSGEPRCIIDHLPPILLHIPPHSKRNLVFGYSNGLHHLWCCTDRL